MPGDLEASLAIERVFSKDPDQVMPPPKSKKTLTDKQKDLLKRWVASGADYQPLWSFIPPKRSALPQVKDKTWGRNPVDDFILAKLEASGLPPAPEADRPTLARRAALDLTGLPPEPAAVEAFVKDPSADAYEKYVDRLLDSPRYGEHRARYWLDLARYADTHGIHFDNYREIWSYRDWVISAFNRNLPFDRFTIEQLAGDLLPNRTLDQQIASGFNRCNITTNEGGVIKEEYFVLYTRDRTETASAIWMGLTANCAVCHDHKFDPISQREFYQLAAFFNNTTQDAMDGNIHNTPPTIFVPGNDDKARWGAYSSELEATRKTLDARKTIAKPDFDKWLKAATRDAIVATLPSAGLKLKARLDEVNPTTEAAKKNAKRSVDALEIADAGDFEKDQAFSYGAWVNLRREDRLGSVFARMDDGDKHRGWDLWVENNRIAVHLVNRWPEDALKVVTQTDVKPLEWNHLFMTYDGSGKAEGVKIYFNGVVQPVEVASNSLKSTIRTKVPLKVGQRNNSARLEGVSVQDLRLYGRALSSTEAADLAQNSKAGWLVAKTPSERSSIESDELLGWWLRRFDAPSKVLGTQLAKLEAEKAAVQARGTIAHVMQERMESPAAYILNRGDYDKRKDQVQAKTPEVLPPMPADLPRNRLGFAQWLLRPEHPLTARVTVNRIWQEVFGAGLVRTSGDFGVNGDLPTHPELLDWLAVEFREKNWEVKSFYKLLLTSSTYRQGAVMTPAKLEKDPLNKLLSRGPRFRMDAEMVRDYALAAGGLLVPKIGGPSVKPYQPEGVWEAVAMIGSNTRDYRVDKGDALYRRSLYTFWKRSAPPASMEIFNAPSREVCSVRRERTNTPLQALVTLNDPQFVEAARRLAESALKRGGGETDGSIDFIADRLLARRLRAEERVVVKKSLDELLDFYKKQPKLAGELVAFGESKPDASLDRPTLAAWTMLVNELMNLDEVLNK